MSGLRPDDGAGRQDAEPAGAPHDVIADDLRLLIVAINPSTRSAAIGGPFSSPGDPFWRLLHVSGLTPTQLEADQAHRLLDVGIGLTSTVQRPTPTAAELSVAERREGAQEVRRLVCRRRPRMVGLLGLTLYPLFFHAQRASGPGLKAVRLEDAAVVRAAEPERPNRAYPGFVSKLAWYRELARTLGPD